MWKISQTRCAGRKKCPPPPLPQVAQETSEAQSILLEAVESRVARQLCCAQRNYKPAEKSISRMAHGPNSALEMAICQCQWTGYNLRNKSSVCLQVNSRPPHETTTPSKTPEKCGTPRNSTALCADVNRLHQRQHDPTTRPPVHRPILPRRHQGTAKVLA